MKLAIKRALALCLVLVLALSLMAVSAGAAEAVPFSLTVSDNGDGTLTVSLVGTEALAAFGAADGIMSYDSGRFTLESIEAGALLDMTPNVAQARFAASAKDYTNGDSIAAGAEWLRYVFRMADSIPDGKYTFTLSFTNGVDVSFQKYAWSSASVSESWRKGAGNFTLEVEADGTDKLVAKLVGLQAVPDFGAADAVIDWTDHTHLTLQSIEGVALKDLTANVNTGRFGASAEDFTNGDSMAAGAVWVKYTFLVDENTPSGDYVFSLSFENGVNVSFQDYPWKEDTVTGSYTLEASPAVNLAAVAAAKAAIEGADWTVEQATANTAEMVKSCVETQIAALDLGTVETAVTVTAITPAIAGTEAAAAGTEGSFAFTVALTLNEAADTATVTDGKITPTAYVPKLAYQTALEATLNYIQATDTAPQGGGSEWHMLALGRGGVTLTKDYADGYVSSAKQFVTEQIAEVNDGDRLHKKQSTDNSRMILALTALGIDPRDVDGHDLTKPLNDLSYVQWQGINGPIWALIALDSHGYDIAPLDGSGTQATRENIVELLLSKQLTDGGWALSGTEGDSDITTMTLQALAPYYEANAAVKTAVDKALDCLSAMQRADGHYTNFYSEICSESTAQVVVALSAMGIDADADPRFVKNGVSALDALLSFFVEGGGFEHMPGAGLDGIATEQGAYALVAYDRFKAGKTALYDMSDVSFAEETSEDLATVRFHLNGGAASGITDGEEKTYTKDEDGAKLPTPSRSGYTFDGWYDAETGGTKVEAVSASLPGDLYARWTENSSGGGSGGGGGDSGEPATDKMTIRFTLLGAPDDGEDGPVHTLIDNNLQLWYSITKTFEAKSMSAEEVFRTIMEEAGIEWRGNSKNQYSSLYVSGIKNPQTGEWMEEFTTTPNSGWMYTVNGTHPSVGLSLFTLYDGDEFVVHFTDDYTKEEDAAKYNEGGGSSGSGDKSGDGSGAAAEKKEAVIEVTAEVKGGEAKAEVEAEAITETLAAVGDAEVLTVQVESEAAETVELALDAEAVKAAADAEADLHIETEQGTVKLAADTLSELAEAGGEVVVSVKANADGSMTLNVTVDGESADVTVKVELPAAEEGQVLVIVHEDGTEEIVKKSVVEGDTVYAEIPAGATLTVVENNKKFSDVSDNAWYAGAVDFASSHDLFRGVSETEFAPQSPMTRAMLATVLFRLENEPEGAVGMKFGDVKDDTWYTDAVAWASENGIVNGTGNGFEPNANITREQIATMIYRYVNYLGIDTGARGDVSKFKDGKEVSSWAADAMAWAVKVGLFKGDDTGSLNPKADATRAEVATLMERLVKLIVM